MGCQSDGKVAGLLLHTAKKSSMHAWSYIYYDNVPTLNVDDVACPTTISYSIHVTAAGVHKDVFILNGILIATINMSAGKEGIGVQRNKINVQRRGCWRVNNFNM